MAFFKRFRPREQRDTPESGSGRIPVSVTDPAYRYGIKAGYQHREKAVSFPDVCSAMVYQPKVYQFARYLAERAGIGRIVDIGCGSGRKLLSFTGSQELVGIDTAQNLAFFRDVVPTAQAIEADLEQGLPAKARELSEDAIVVCADVLEHLMSPDRLLTDLSALTQTAPFILLSTPDRVRARGVGDFGPPGNEAHVREWTIDEFDWLLRDFGFGGYLTGHTVNADTHLWKSTILVIAGKWAAPGPPASTDRCLAIVAVHNDVDIVENVVLRLVAGGVDVWLIDDWSDDGSWELLQRLKMERPQGIVGLERYGAIPKEHYDWTGLLQRKEEIAAAAAGYEWILHQDSDEIRESPWRDLTLAQALTVVGRLGFNAVDHTVIDFRPIVEGFFRGTDPMDFFRFFEFGRRPGHFSQIRSWRRDGASSPMLGTSGGHEATFSGRRVFPLKFLNRHYPLRSPHQAREKMQDRLRRIHKEKAEKGWHTHWESLQEQIAPTFLWKVHDLLPYNPNHFEAEFIVERLSGLGLTD